MFRKLNAFLQQIFNVDQLLLILKTLTNLNEIQIESFFDVDQLLMKLNVLTSSNKTQSEIKSIRDINARALYQKNLVFNSNVSITNDLLSNFDFIIKSLFFDKSKTIFKHIHFIALKIVQTHTKFFNSYVQNMIV